MVSYSVTLRPSHSYYDGQLFCHTLPVTLVSWWSVSLSHSFPLIWLLVILSHSFPLIWWSVILSHFVRHTRIMMVSQSVTLCLSPSYHDGQLFCHSSPVTLLSWWSVILSHSACHTGIMMVSQSVTFFSTHMIVSYSVTLFSTHMMVSYSVTLRPSHSYHDGQSVCHTLPVTLISWWSVILSLFACHTHIMMVSHSVTLFSTHIMMVICLVALHLSHSYHDGQ